MALSWEPLVVIVELDEGQTPVRTTWHWDTTVTSRTYKRPGKLNSTTGAMCWSSSRTCNSCTTKGLGFCLDVWGPFPQTRMTLSLGQSPAIECRVVQKIKEGLLPCIVQFRVCPWNELAYRNPCMKCLAFLVSVISWSIMGSQVG